MKVAHIVFDLPIEGWFDYLIPECLVPRIRPGARVKVLLGSKPMVGFVIAVADGSSIPKIKTIKAVVDKAAIFDDRDMAFARQFAAYYGCSLGSALGTIMRHRTHLLSPNLLTGTAGHPGLGTATVYHCLDGKYFPIIEELTQGRADYFIVVPEAAVARGLGLPVSMRSRVGLRSSMFEAFIRHALIIVIDEDNPSFKQEQSPMYETRQVVLMAQKVYGFSAAFIGVSPSVDVLHLARIQAVGYQLRGQVGAPVTTIDLANYRFIDKGILSPPVQNALQANVKTKRQSLLVLNRRGNYSVTRCAACGYILKCPHCEVTLVYTRAQRKFACRHCSFHSPLEGACPQCGGSKWKAFGMGVEQVQKELSSLFPTASIAHFDQGSKEAPKDFDIVVATQAILRLRRLVYVQTVVVVDFDAELSRAQLRSSFKAWSLVQHLRLMGAQTLIQTRNPAHHVVRAVGASVAGAAVVERYQQGMGLFYDEELRLRKELGFAPFYHWVMVTARGKTEKIARSTMEDVYNRLAKNTKGITVTAVTADSPAKLRDQYRFRLMAGGSEVVEVIALIKGVMPDVKRSGKTKITINVDP